MPPVSAVVGLRHSAARGSRIVSNAQRQSSHKDERGLYGGTHNSIRRRRGRARRETVGRSADHDVQLRVASDRVRSVSPRWRTPSDRLPLCSPREPAPVGFSLPCQACLARKRREARRKRRLASASTARALQQYAYKVAGNGHDPCTPGCLHPHPRKRSVCWRTELDRRSILGCRHRRQASPL